jgi:peptide-methionine (S)-S-oxide reductase
MIGMKLAALALLAMALAGSTLQVSRHCGNRELKTAIFAAGCFWGVQATFDHVVGVVSTEAGYTGGTDPHPTHTSIAAGHSGHVEAVRITYDPTQISYAELLDIFWACHNPTIDLSTGPGEGPGRSMIFVRDGIQDRIARQSLAELTASGRFGAPIVTQIAPVSAFYPAESEHQHYADLHGTRCAVHGDAVHTRLAADARQLRMAS